MKPSKPSTKGKSATTKPGPKILDIYNSNIGLCMFMDELLKQITITQLKNIDDTHFTITHVKRLGKREISNETRKFYYVQAAENRKFLVVARFCDFINAVLAHNPAFKYRIICTLSYGHKLGCHMNADHLAELATCNPVAMRYTCCQNSVDSNLDGNLNDNPDNNLDSNLDSNLDDDPGITPDANQQLIFDHLLATIYTESNINLGLASTILVMPTGSGKSYLAAMLAVKFGYKTLIVLPNSNNLQEWTTIFSTYYPSLRLGSYTGISKTDGDMVFMIINSATSEEFIYKLKSPTKAAAKATIDAEPLADLLDPTITIKFRDYFRTFGFVIYDEIHNYASIDRLEVFWHINLRCTLGLTATPNERSDGFDIVTHKHVGPPLYAEQLPGYNTTTVVWQGDVHIIKYQGSDEHTKHITSSIGYLDAGATNQMVAEDPHRRQLVLNIIKHVVDRGVEIFIFAERIEQITSLQACLDTIGITSTKLIGGQSLATNAEAKRAQVIFMSYSYGSEGISLPTKTAILFYTSRRGKMRQIIGRILRLGGDLAAMREIYDLVDVGTGLKKQLTDRKREYKAKAFNIYMHRINHSDVAWPPADSP